MKARQYDFCAPCAAKEEAKLAGTGLRLSRVAGGVNNKITCWGCGRRRYGARYTVEAEK